MYESGAETLSEEEEDQNVAEKTATAEELDDKEIEDVLARLESRKSCELNMSSDTSMEIMDAETIRKNVEECTTMFQQQKINNENAFGLKMIDIIWEIIHMPDFNKTDLSKISTTLDVLMKIFSCRVENTYQFVSKLAHSIQNALKLPSKDNKKTELVPEANEAISDNVKSLTSKKKKFPNTNLVEPSTLIIKHKESESRNANLLESVKNRVKNPIYKVDAGKSENSLLMNEFSLANSLKGNFNMDKIDLEFLPFKRNLEISVNTEEFDDYGFLREAHPDRDHSFSDNLNINISDGIDNLNLNNTMNSDSDRSGMDLIDLSKINTIEELGELVMKECEKQTDSNTLKLKFKTNCQEKVKRPERRKPVNKILYNSNLKFSPRKSNINYEQSIDELVDNGKKAKDTFLEMKHKVLMYRYSHHDPVCTCPRYIRELNPNLSEVQKLPLDVTSLQSWKYFLEKVEEIWAREEKEEKELIEKGLLVKPIEIENNKDKGCIGIDEDPYFENCAIRDGINLSTNAGEEANLETSNNYGDELISHFESVLKGTNTDIFEITTLEGKDATSVRFARKPPGVDILILKKLVKTLFETNFLNKKEEVINGCFFSEVCDFVYKNTTEDARLRISVSFILAAVLDITPSMGLILKNIGNEDFQVCKMPKEELAKFENNASGFNDDDLEKDE